MSNGMFRLLDRAALDAMLKRTHVRVVRPMDVKRDVPAKSGVQCQCGKPMTNGSKTCAECYRAVSMKGCPMVDYVGVLVRQIAREGLPEPRLEYVFAKDIGRAWRIDIAYPDIKLAIEVDGMAHRIRERFMADIEKQNELMFHGWRLLRIYTRWITSGQCERATGIELVKRAIEVAT